MFVCWLVVSLLLACDAQELTQAELLAAGECSTWSGAPSACAGVLTGTPIWTAPTLGLSESYFVYTANTTFMPALLSLPYDCAEMYLRLFCPTVFQPCTNEEAVVFLIVPLILLLDPTLCSFVNRIAVFVFDFPHFDFAAVPHPPCKSVCDDANTACATFWTLAGLLPIDCDTVSPLTGSDQWPANGTYVFGCDPVPVEDLGTIDYSSLCPAGRRWVTPPNISFSGLPCDYTPDELTAPLPKLVLLNTGTCQEQWIETPQMCSGLLNGLVQSPIWTAPLIGLTQEYFVNALNNTPTAVGSDQTILSPVLAMPLNCSTYYLRLFCGTSFQSCSNVSEIGFSVPHPPCRSVCRDANEACAAFFEANGADPINCSMTSALTGDVQWPEDDGSYAFGCDPWPVQQMAATIYDCPTPMRWLAPEADANSGAPCGLDCINLTALPLPTVQTFRSGWIFFMVFSWLSWFGGLYVFLTYIVFPDLWRFPHRLITPMAFGVLCMFTPMLGDSGMGVNNDNTFLCDTPLSVSRYNGVARWSAWSFHFGAWLISNYWVVQSLSLFIFVVFGVSIHSFKKLEPLFHIGAIGLALGMTFAPLGLESYGSELLLPFPYFSAYAPLWMTWVFWDGWIFLYLVQEAITSGTSFIVMMVKGKDANHKGWRRQDQFKILGFALVFFVTALASLTLELKNSTNDQTEQVTQWYQCMYTGGDANSCEVYVPTIPVGLFWWAVITFSWIGIDGFIMFGMGTHRPRTAWITGIRNLREGKPFTQPDEKSEADDEE